MVFCELIPKLPRFGKSLLFVFLLTKIACGYSSSYPIIKKHNGILHYMQKFINFLHILVITQEIGLKNNQLRFLPRSYDHLGLEYQFTYWYQITHLNEYFYHLLLTLKYFII